MRKFIGMEAQIIQVDFIGRRGRQPDTAVFEFEAGDDAPPATRIARRESRRQVEEPAAARTPAYDPWVRATAAIGGRADLESGWVSIGQAAARALARLAADDIEGRR